MAKKQTVSGFAAGTLVHTKEGLKPIETIKVADLILSKPENGEGEQSYKHVLKTFAHPPERVIRVIYILDESRRIDVINTTLNNLFWVENKGWKKAKDFRGQNTASTGKDKLTLSDGRQMPVYQVGNIYISDQPGVGWTPISSDGYVDYTTRPGDLWDYVNHRLVATDVPALKNFAQVIEFEDFEEGEDADSFFLKLPLYSLEVEDFHTYYVGKHSVWVHE